MSTLFSDDFNRANGGAGTNYTDLLGALNVASNKVVGSGGTWVSRVDGGSVPDSNCWVQFVISTIPASGDAFNLYLRTNLVTNNGYAIVINNTLARLVRADAGITTTIGADFSLPSAGQTVRFEFQGSTLSLYYDDVLQGIRTDSNYTGSFRALLAGVNTTGEGDDLAIGNLPAISSATPSGTLGTTTTATVGCTTDDGTGTLYVVVDTASLSGITATQVKAGQNASSVTAIASGNSAVSGSSPSVGVTGLSAGTAYNYAIVQFSGGNSNILTGSFTTKSGLAVLLSSGTKFITSGGKILRL